MPAEAIHPGQISRNNFGDSLSRIESPWIIERVQAAESEQMVCRDSEVFCIDRVKNRGSDNGCSHRYQNSGANEG